MASTKRIELVVVKKTGGEEMIFSSLRKASEYIGVSSVQLSRILKGQRENNTKFFITPN